MSGFLISDYSSGLNLDVSVTGNAIFRDQAALDWGYGIEAACRNATSGCVQSANINGNTISGGFSVGISANPGVSVTIKNNNIYMTGVRGNTGIQSQSRSTWPASPPVDISGNNLTFTTAGYQTAIEASLFGSSGVQSFVRGNSVTSPGFTGGARDGFSLYSNGGSVRSGNIFNSVLEP
jgi:hypothetical protein